MRIELVLLGTLCVVTVAVNGCREKRDTAPVIGQFVRVFPPEGAPDTLALHEDGSVSGSTAGLDSIDIARTHWKIDNETYPGLCIGQDRPLEPRFECVAYEVSGDTLWLGNERSTTFLRIRPGQPPLAVSPWQTPRRYVLGVRPDDTISVAPGTERSVKLGASAAKR
jgi:hypothetical protein